MEEQESLSLTVGLDSIHVILCIFREELDSFVALITDAEVVIVEFFAIKIRPLSERSNSGQPRES